MSLTMMDYKEKRDFIRMPIDAGITLSATDDDKTLAATCTNLSGGGMAVELPEPVAVGAEFTTRLPSSNSKFPSFETKIRVVRCNQLDNSTFIIGAMIVEVI